MTYVYKQTDRDPALYTVGHYTPHGKWESESDHGTADEAAARVHYLNGGDRTNPEGLTLTEWLRAAGYGDNRYVSKGLRLAWARGEDPTEHVT